MAKHKRPIGRVHVIAHYLDGAVLHDRVLKAVLRGRSELVQYRHLCPGLRLGQLRHQGLDIRACHPRTAKGRLLLTGIRSPGIAASDMKRAVGGSCAEDVVGRVMGPTAPYIARSKSLFLMRA